VWYPVEEFWQYRVLDQLPSGIDEAQLRAALAMTPTERVEAVRRLQALCEQLQAARRRHD